MAAACLTCKTASSAALHSPDVALCGSLLQLHVVRIAPYLRTNVFRSLVCSLLLAAQDCKHHSDTVRTARQVSLPRNSLHGQGTARS